MCSTLTLLLLCFFSLFFLFNDTATTEIYTLSLHDALPISLVRGSFLLVLGQLAEGDHAICQDVVAKLRHPGFPGRSDRKSTRLNSSHPSISYAVFCLKKKKKKKNNVKK